MRDVEKIARIRELLADLTFLNDGSDKGKFGWYFDYDGVITCLEKAQQIQKKSLRCPRPADLPADMVWSEKPFDPDTYDFDPDSDGFDYVYDGSMSPEDYEKVAAAHEAAMIEKDSRSEDDSVNPAASEFENEVSGVLSPVPPEDSDSGMNRTGSVTVEMTLVKTALLQKMIDRLTEEKMNNNVVGYNAGVIDGEISALALLGLINHDTYDLLWDKHPEVINGIKGGT